MLSGVLQSLWSAELTIQGGSMAQNEGSGDNEHAHTHATACLNVHIAIICSSTALLADETRGAVGWSCTSWLHDEDRDTLLGIEWMPSILSSEP